MKPFLMGVGMASIVWAGVVGLIDAKHGAERAAVRESLEEAADRIIIAEDTLTLMFGETWDANRLSLDEVTVTAYQSKPAQTDDTPWLNASGGNVLSGQVAVSRDLGLRFGQVVHLVGYGSFVVADVMGPRARKQADIWTGLDGKAARLHGVQRGVTMIYLKG